VARGRGAGGEADSALWQIARVNSSTLAPTITFLVLASLGAREAAACTPWAEKVVGWDIARDLVVVSSWRGRERPPRGSLPPDRYELRRMSTGEQVTLHRCPETSSAPGHAAEMAACNWRAAFANWLPTEPRSPEAAPPGSLRRLRIHAGSTAEGQEFSLESRVRGVWRRVLWLDFIPRGYREYRTYEFGPFERAGDDALITVRFHARGGNCNQTVVQVLRVPQEDLDNPGNSGRRARLAAQVRRDGLLEHWRTLSELGPLPADALLEAMSAAENEGRSGWGVRWWQEAIRHLPPERVTALSAALERHPHLTSTRDLLKAPTAVRRNQDPVR
jgi:hypothetical protein